MRRRKSSLRVYRDVLGKMAAEVLLRDGHRVTVHARSKKRLEAVRDLIDRGAVGVFGDLAVMAQALNNDYGRRRKA